MPKVIDISKLAVDLQEKKEDYEKIFSIKVRNGFDTAKKHLKVLGIDQKARLIRETMTNITQPGRKGNLNNVTDFLSYNERVGELKPAKVDIELTEQMIYDLRVSFLSNQQPADTSDIHSIAGRDYIIGRIFRQVGKEAMAAIYKGVLGSTGPNNSPFNGGLNLCDGLGLKFDLGYAAVGTVAGAVGDIPLENKIVGAAASFTEANALAELRKILDKVYDTEHLHDICVSEDPEDENYLHMPATYFKAMQIALDNLTYKQNQLVEPAGEGMYQFKALPGLKIKAVPFLSGVDNMYWAPKNNIFFLRALRAEDTTKLKIQEVGRNIQILLDWELGFDYADGRQIVLYK